MNSDRMLDARWEAQAFDASRGGPYRFDFPRQSLLQPVAFDFKIAGRLQVDPLLLVVEDFDLIGVVVLPDRFFSA